MGSNPTDPTKLDYPYLFLEAFWKPNFPYDPTVIGFAIIVFLWFQFPHMLRPDFLVLPMPTSDKSYEEPKGDETVHVAAGEEKLLMFRVTSLGTHTYKDCSTFRRASNL